METDSYVRRQDAPEGVKERPQEQGGREPWLRKIDLQRTGRMFGRFFIATFITSIPARLLFVNGVGATWSDMDSSPEPDPMSRAWGSASTFEFLLIVVNVATAVVIYPLVKRQSATFGLGYVSARIMESGFYRHRSHQHHLGHLA